ncbi:MAG: zinc ribbon domain-containing protein [Actinomycetota bacterium]|jgi:putative FmdB family regulatory protein|nr:zinc ribbon domain-containing protein [Actinomycetota bacterium]
MPIYSYKCTSCGQVFDKLQKPGGNGKIKCEYCEGEAIKVFSPVGIIFKGSGFYKTDYGSKSKVSSTSSTSSSSTQDKGTKKEKKASDKEVAKTSKSAS